MINILVTGSNGQLGSQLKNLSSNYESYIFFFTDKTSLDILNINLVENFITQNSIQAVINCAAYTNVDKAEVEFEKVNQVNHFAVENLAIISKKHHVKLIHISTDYVFDGLENIAYKEEEPTNPKNNYGISKLKGELAMQENNPPHSIIIRTSWLYSIYGRNFVKTILKLSEFKDEISVVSDQIGSPTDAKDLAKLILDILPLINSTGVKLYHYASVGVCSWFEFAKEIINISKRNCNVRAISSKEYKTEAFRPSFSMLDSTKIQNEFGISIPKWKDSLKECVTGLMNKN